MCKWGKAIEIAIGKRYVWEAHAGKFLLVVGR